MTTKANWHGLATLVMICIFYGVGAYASAPQQKSQAPGYYRIMLGKFEITALSDGTSPLPVDQLLTNTTPAQIDAGLQKAFLKEPVMTSTNAILINTGAKLVLVDAGFGNFLGPAQGKLLSNLKAAGYRPEQVDEIYITHMHGDHVGGLVIADKAAFPNAVVRADAREADFWLSKERMDQAPEPLKGFFVNAMKALKPYRDQGRFKPFRGDTDLMPGIKAQAVPGHTAGHTVYAVQSDGEQLLIVGDLIHVASIQFAEPSVTIRFDGDSAAAADARVRTLREASIAREWIAGAHIAFPGIGHVRVDGNGFEFVPANYESTP
jgi:glyoxylase-like metal-dependent hydrolase (beta-lactamase superfamily II)